MYAIGVDIGGMSIKVGLVNDNGEIVKSNRSKTEKTAEKCIENLSNQINELLNEYNLKATEIEGIGVGCPGAVNGETGIVDILPNLNWHNVPLVDILRQYFDTKIKISNDANVATLAEVFYGVAKGADIAVMFTLGTGVGGGVVIDKKLFEGWHSKGAELGHTTLVLGGIPCACGRNGCIERYVSATALIEQTKKEMLKNKNSSMWQFVDENIDNVDGRTAFECAKKGDKSAITVRDNYVKYLSESIMSMVNIFRPQVFILGGGVSAQGEYLNNLVREYCEKYGYGYKDAPVPKILTAKLGNDAGIIGASCLLKYN